MGRPLRIDHPGTWYHVVNRGVERRVIFVDDRDRVEFGRLLGLACEQVRVFVHVYCLMSNHFHLVVECPDGGISEFVRRLCSPYVRYFNDRHGRDGPLFKGRFFARSIEHDADLVAVARYVHRNPLAFLAAEALESYRWSSLRTHLGHRAPLSWMRTDVIAAVFGGHEGLRALTLVDEWRSDESQPGAARAATSWQHLIALAIDEHVDDLPTHRVDRTVTIRLLDRVDLAERRGLCEALAFPTERAEYEARRRAKARAEQHPAIDRAVEAVLRAAA